jgi:predicted MFS family arabinose efflux permease
VSWVLVPPNAPAWRLTVACATGWLALSITALAIVLQVIDATGSSAAAGVAAAGYGLAAALVGVPRARLVDRFGPGRVLPRLAVGHALALCGFVVAAKAGAPAAVLVALTFLASASTPPVIGVARAQWSEWIPEEDLPKAYALMAMFGDLAQVLGPPAAVLLATLVDPAAGLAATAVLVVLTTFLVIGGRTGPARQADSTPGPTGRSRVAIRFPGLQTLVLSGVALGAGLGAIDVLVPVLAIARDEGWTAGLMLGAYGVGGVVGSLVSPRLSGTPIATRYIGGIAALVAVTATLVLSPSWWTIAAILAVAGVAWGITNVVLYEALDVVVPKENSTEAWSWLSTAEALGIAGGASLAGIVAAQSMTAALAMTPVALAVALLVSVFRRSGLTAGSAIAPITEQVR